MRTTLRVGVVSAIVALFVSGTAISAQADVTSDAVNYVALGDSYSSGTGTAEYTDTDCLLSNHSYPQQLASQLGLTLTFDACSGAVIDDVRNSQMANLNADTDLVTMSIGGNDTGWSDVVVSCARPWPWTCWGDIDNAEAYVTNTLPGRLDSLYSEIRAAAPNAQVVIVGYPRLFNGESCNVITRISGEEQARLNEAADLLGDTIGSVASAHGFDYVDPRGAFDGHAVCDDEEWLNGLSWPIVESFHPNRSGHDAYTDLIAPLV
ncbi:SGNH/GDSL hydrolase family protein [Stackebrandtia soli]|uniref:SGNH/GDSL hydrolase family protein n=1 Tax=Stackebrandtia soli TaxID=1892856 RepID=UPI0039E7B58A